MPRATIDFGIDLGTTNSCVALARGNDVEILRNNEGQECTPSALWIDRKDRLHVGRRAREQFEIDEENACLEFKLQMGRSSEKHFQRSNRRMKPEEMSAEVLKSLLGDVRQRLGEEVDAAVITVPADFDLPQCDATRRAAELAGLRLSPLLQEPVAAALAYGARHQADQALWLVFDLGGGTFDAAVIHLRDGLFRVVNHGGDRHLGGKLVDWAIVDHLLVPVVERELKLVDFHRGNPTYRAAFAKLKLAAEQAKIRLSRDPVAEIALDLPDGQGGTRPFDCDLERARVESLLEPFVLRAIHICRNVLSEKRLDASDVQKLLLVGGPTLTPYLRERLSDPKEGLGIELETGLDPMTVVCRGAALFAGTHRRSGVPAGPAIVGAHLLQLEYQPVGIDPEPLVGGRLTGPDGSSIAGFAIEFVEPDARPERRSGKVVLSADGTFVTNLWATPGRTTTFHVELTDAAGRPVPIAPDRIEYTLGLTPSDPPLTHSLGIAMANNELDVLLPKGTSLPARKRVVHRIARAVRKDQGGDLVRIPVVEGENVRRADRNRLIGTLEIGAAKVRRDVPAGSEIEITIEIDASRLLRTKAYLPLLDEEYDDVVKFRGAEADLAQLQAELNRERRRLDEVRQRAQHVADPKAERALQRIERERIEQDTASALAAAAHDPDAADKCQDRLLDFKTAIDEAEDALEWPALVAQLDQEIGYLKDAVVDFGKASERQQAQTLEREARAAVKVRDVEMLRRKLREIAGLRYRILQQQPAFWIGYLGHLETRLHDVTDPVLAEQLTQRAHEAHAQNDLPALRGAVEQLASLVPDECAKGLTGFGGTTLR